MCREANAVFWLLIVFERQLSVCCDCAIFINGWAYMQYIPVQDKHSFFSAQFSATINLLNAGLHFYVNIRCDL